MKPMRTFVTGLICYTAVLNAQSTGADARTGSENRSAASTIHYREMIWTNGLFVSPANEDGFAERSFSLRSEGTNHSAEAVAYRVIDLSRNEAMDEVIDNEQANRSGENTNRTFSAEELKQWKYGASSTAQSEHQIGKGGKKPTRIVVLEPLNTSEGMAPDSFRLREYMFDGDQSGDEEYAWFHPRMILSRWKSYWVNGTEATPVVIVLIRF